MTTRTATFTVKLSQVHAISVNINYITKDDTAIAGKDYTTVSGTLTFAAGETQKTVDVLVQAKSDRNLNFFLRLANPVNCTLTTNNSGSATIEPDNGVVALSNAAKAARDAYNAAVELKNQRTNEQATAQTNYNNANASYNSWVSERNAANSALASAQAYVNDRQNNLNNIALLAALGYASWWQVAAAQNELNSAVASRDAAQNRVNVANANSYYYAVLVDTSSLALTTANSNLSAATVAASSALSAYESARTTAAAAFVGSTTLVL